MNLPHLCSLLSLALQREDVFPLWEKQKSSGLGLSLNGSQFGGCSTKYNTLADT